MPTTETSKTRPRRFSKRRIAGILDEHETGTTVAELCRRHGMSSTTFYKWRLKYRAASAAARSGPLPRPLAALEGENRRLKELLANAVLENATLKELLVRRKK
jgi:putative transposase